MQKNALLAISLLSTNWAADTSFTFVIAVSLAVILVTVAAFMPRGLPIGSKSVSFTQVTSKDVNINRLSLARMFLFGERDVWFVVGIPIYFHAVLSDEGSHDAQTTFLMAAASWVSMRFLAKVASAA